MKKETTYLVVETHSAYVTVLDNEGRFIKAANTGYETGDITDKVIPIVYPQDRQKRRAYVIRIAAGIAASVCAGIFGIYEYQYIYTEYGSVHMQINPEVEISLSRSGRVLDVEGENADGRALVRDYEYKGKDKETVVDELAGRAIDQEYLSDGGQIAITVDARSGKWAERTETELLEELNRYLAEQDITVELTVGPLVRPENTEDDTEEKKVLDEPQTVTVPIPQQQEDADSPYEEDDGITDYGVPADPQPVQTVPRLSVQPDNDSGYEADSGDSPYESNDDSGGNSPYESNDDSGGNSSYESNYDSDDDGGGSPYDNDDD